MAAASTERTNTLTSSVSSDQKVQEPANDIRHPRWPLWTDSSPDAGLELPELKGEDNFELWDRSVLDTFKIYGLEGFVKGTETPPPSDTAEDYLDLQTFNDRRLCAFRIIYTSSTPIHLQLLPYGYDGYQLPDVLDPQVLWDAIHRWDVAVHLNTLAKVKLVRELSHIHHSGFDNLREFMRRANWLRRRLERAGVPIADELMKTYVLSGLTRYPDENWVTSLFIKASDWTYFTLGTNIEKQASWESVGECQVKPSKPQHLKKRRNARGRRPGHPHREGARQRGSRY
ncbi:hypothetical protein B0H65DRAFT_439750 [Neurospora tetraspora]|uniref:Uncharacterized protein n=1 Tax=Neurospora tetraspora TaxID=94610 RepID=A0AAE0JJD5_9PEZI|nr:hypothetical protein B0H65DRAFT_439750 [Neurospora tetraspora]